MTALRHENHPTRFGYGIYTDRGTWDILLLRARTNNGEDHVAPCPTPPVPPRHQAVWRTGCNYLKELTQSDRTVLAQSSQLQVTREFR
jgi:hypothetical protein